VVAIWLVHVQIGGTSLAEYLVNFLNPLGVLIGLNGGSCWLTIAIPANEIVIPTVLMLTVLMSGLSGVGAGAGVMFVADQAGTLSVLQAGGWTPADGIQPGCSSA
jgi:ferrous iron transport protein B